MNGTRRSTWLRPLGWGLMVGLLFLTTGDRGATAPPPGIGIDPFEVLDLQIKNNVLIVLDTSGSMKWPTDLDNFTLGGDDPASRLFQAKAAIRSVVNSNQTRINFGLATYNILGNAKTLNQGQDFEGDGRKDGPFIYVSADSQAANFYTPHTSTSDGVSAACNTVDGFFCQVDNTFANYDGAASAEVWRSFMNRGGAANPTNLAYDDPYPAGCTPVSGVTPAPPLPGSQLTPVDTTVGPLMRCRYYMQSRQLRNNTRYTWNRGTGNLTLRLVATTPIVGGCGTVPPPAGLVGYVAAPTPCYQMQDGVGGPISTFYYSSAVFEAQSGSSCGGGAAINTVSPCSGNNAPAIGLQMDAELPVSATGTIPDLAGAFTTTDFTNGDNPTLRGLRADQSTPLAGTLDFVRTVNAPSPIFPVQGDPRQKNFVILLTDGDDTCAGGTADQAAVTSAVAAEALYDQGGFNPDPNAVPACGNQQGCDPRHRAETFVVAFASAVNVARTNVIAQGGSGANITAGAPLATAVGTCKTGATCRPAFTASTTQQLIDVLNQALAQAVSSGEFSTTASVFDAPVEYVATAPLPVPSPPATPLPPLDPMDPTARYDSRALRTYRTAFLMPNFRGQVRAFGPTGQLWEAGQRLSQRLESDLVLPNQVPPGAEITFAQLHGGLDQPKPTASARIDRRIFTTVRNGVSPTRVMLWPPTTAVAPPDYTTAGSLDNILGIGAASSPVLTLPDLQAAPFRACMGVTTSLPPLCIPPPTGTATAAQVLAAARREAREMILAFAAGAVPRVDANSNPMRDPVTKLIQYRRRSWLLSETTLATPALVVPPLQQEPTVHNVEYQLYRDGPRVSTGPLAGQAPTFCPATSGPCLDEGFGLRNPDNDGRENPPVAGGTFRPSLKPVMSVIYIAANDMLHAFRAGPCPTNPAAANLLCRPPTNGLANNGYPAGIPNIEQGGEELWAFVPYDLLPKLRRSMLPQTRDDHTFMLANNLRFGDIFVPSATPFTIEGRSYTGRWRRILVVGRGLGAQTTTVTTPTAMPAVGGAFGKYYTTLDITAPGPFTKASLDTQLPNVLWSRGNPDIQTPGGPLNGLPSDQAAYATMGQTWSVPAISRVSPSFASREFVLYTGSGYPEVPSEGSTFYTLDPVTGEVLASSNVGDGAPAAAPLNFDNAIVAGPVVYTPELFVAAGARPNPAGLATRATYVGDIHGRMWKFPAATSGTSQLLKDFGRSQPVAVAAALFNLTPGTALPGTAGVFVSTGNDARVPDTGQFQLWGLNDSGTLPANPTPGFPRSLPTRFRGTVQPVTTISALTPTGGAFFAATRFNPATTQCVSSFDTVLFGVSVLSGGAAYDLDSTTGGIQDSVTFTGVKAVGMPRPPRAAGEELGALDQGVPGASGNLPSPTPPPPPPVGGTPVVSARSVSFNSSVCR
jgi:hypothetical protein